MMRGHGSLAEVTPQLASSSVALSKHVGQVPFGPQGQKPDSREHESHVTQ